MNVLIYSGNGTSPNSVKQTFLTLKSILGHAHDIMKVDANTLHNEPWQDHCSLIVIPGGRDLPYCQDLKGTAVEKIKRFVHGGGRYLGFCAGAYYASKDIEFEKGTPMEVVGHRELGFYPGTSCGAMFPGFVYNSEKGARAISIFSKQQNKSLKAYYNGGGYFAGAKGVGQKVKVICTYEELGKSDEREPAAAVQCQVGEGSALLFGFHPEYDINFADLEDNEQKASIKKELIASLPLCRELLSQSLSTMGLNVSPQNDVLKLTPLYLSTISKELLVSVTEKINNTADINSSIKDSNDIFSISEMKTPPVETLTNHIKDLSVESESKDILQVVYPQKSMTKDFQIPDNNTTPSVNIDSFFNYLLNHRKQEWGGGSWYQFGNAVLCSEVITSTQTVLDKNYKFSQCLPSGLICLATNQTAGRGRGRNSWVSQADALQFSFIVRHSIKHKKAPVVFIQYLIALSIVESIRSRKGYEGVPLRLKWPNDIYADLPNNQGLKKVGGLLVNSSFYRNEFFLVVGCGINLNNSHPTVSVNDVIAQHNPKLEKLVKEDLLAHTLVTFEKYYTEFCEKGMGSWFLDKYYKRWLHSDKLVTLTTHNDERVKIIGITSDYGMLEAVSINDTRKKFTLQPDGNSFDMLKGLIIKKT